MFCRKTGVVIFFSEELFQGKTAKRAKQRQSTLEDEA